MAKAHAAEYKHVVLGLIFPFQPLHDLQRFASGRLSAC